MEQAGTVGVKPRARAAATGVIEVKAAEDALPAASCCSTEAVVDSEHGLLRLLKGRPLFLRDEPPAPSVSAGSETAMAAAIAVAAVAAAAAADCPATVRGGGSMQFGGDPAAAALVPMASVPSPPSAATSACRPAGSAPAPLRDPVTTIAAFGLRSGGQNSSH